MRDEKELIFMSEGKCPACDTKAAIPAARIRDKVDLLTGRKDYDGAARLLEYWRTEALASGDLRGLFVVLNEMMGVYRKMGAGEKAAESAEAALALIPELDYGETISAGTAYVNAGTVYDCFGMPEKALECFQSARRIYEADLGPEDARLGGLYNNMALALAHTGSYEEAFDCYRRALEVMKKQPYGEAEQAITFLNMANAAEEARGLEEAEEEISGYLTSAETLLSDPGLPRNGYYAFVCEKCAPTFSYYGWFLAASELEKRAETIRERLMMGEKEE